MLCAPLTVFDLRLSARCTFLRTSLAQNFLVKKMAAELFLIFWVSYDFTSIRGYSLKKEMENVHFLSVVVFHSWLLSSSGSIISTGSSLNDLYPGNANCSFSLGGIRT